MNTPGPWKHLGGSYAGRIVTEKREVIATVNGVSRGGRGKSSKIHAVANARLIAASPELLELVKRLLCEIPLGHIEANPAVKPFLKTLEELRQVIHKIEGR